MLLFESLRKVYRSKAKGSIISFRDLVIQESNFIHLFLLVFAYCSLGASINSFAGLGMHGAKTVSTTNVILNEFTTLSANVSAGATSITVASSSLNANSRFTGNLAAGELVMIIQMQGATINKASPTSSTWGAITSYNNTGRYEFNEVASVPNSTTINFSFPLLYSYTQTGNVQVIRVPRYSTFTLNASASLTTQAWNGSTGGVLTFESNGNTIINGVINVSGLGFRGGAKDNGSANAGTQVTLYASPDSLQGGEKGEGIAGSQATYDGLGGRYGRGAAANGAGGGNSHNSGGGGGANPGDTSLWNGLGNPDTVSGTGTNWKTAWDKESTNFHTNVSTGGGRGGYAWSKKGNLSPLTTGPSNSSWLGNDRANVGGHGGRPLDNNSGYRIFMGGGGGAGDANSGVGTGGSNGGGIVYILSGGTVSGASTDTINANGSNASSVVSIGSSDGVGGAGGGGTVIVYTNGASISNLNINAKGGKGGDQLDNDAEAEGPGGGGGGGYISTTNKNSLNRDVSAGNNGTTTSSTMTLFSANGATVGRTGTITLIPPNPYSGYVNLPISFKFFSGMIVKNVVELTWITASEINNDYFTVERSGDGSNYFVIGKINGNGNSTVQNTYNLIDDAPLSGNNYYRLSQTDFDGTTEKFDPIQIRFNQKLNGFTIGYFGPSPFNDFVIIDYHSDDAGVAEIQLRNPMGQLVRSAQIAVGKGINSFFFSELASLKSGVYFIRLLQGNNQSQTIRVLKN